MKSDRPLQKPAASGFTLIELIVVLIIAVILSTLAVSGFTNLIRQIRISLVAAELHSAINLTRSEAIRRNGKVNLTAIGGDWKNGWIISSAEKQQILIHPPLPADILVQAKLSDGTQRLAFNGTGQSRRSNNGNASQYGHIYLFLGDHARLIVINFLSRVRICNPASDQACTVSQTD